MPNKNRAIVVGAGVAGLGTAIRLAVKGWQVQVFEKNDYAGGKIASFSINGYTFDEGPSLFTQPGNIDELFSLAGVPMQDYFSYKALPVACRYFFNNGKMVNAYTDIDAFANELAMKLDEDGQKVFTYMQNASRTYNDIGRVFLEHSLHRKSILKAPIKRALAAAKPSLLFDTLNAYNSRSFSKPETVQLFNRFATYNGSNPFQAPAMLSLIPHLEQNQGTFYPEGGMISIAKALHQLALKLGVQFHFNTPVQSIVEKNGIVEGVMAENIFERADVVVSNMDVYFTYRQLLNNEKKAREILKQERSSSAIIFYWGIKKEFPQLHLHNIFFSGNYKEEFDRIFKSKSLYNDPTVYINITSKMEQGHAPAGCGNWFVMVNAPANIGQDWQALRAKCRSAIIHKLSRMLNDDVEQYIEAEQVMDPVNIEEKTASYMGSLYGTSSNQRMAAFLRHPNFSSKIKGLYFAGGSVHPGGGIPLCLHSAKLVSQLIEDDQKTNP